jgi:hypothetical protein
VATLQPEGGRLVEGEAVGEGVRLEKAAAVVVGLLLGL